MLMVLLVRTEYRVRYGVLSYALHSLRLLLARCPPNPD